MWSSLGTQGFLGTAHFASPEQIEEQPVDVRSDIYSLGATLWFMLAGKPPFEGSLARIMNQHLSESPPFDKLPALPPVIVDLLRRMMEKDPAARPQSVGGAAARARTTRGRYTLRQQHLRGGTVRRFVGGKLSTSDSGDPMRRARSCA